MRLNLVLAVAGRGRIKIGHKAGYTLIEMLVSVAIFSGLLIIVLGVVATTSSSSARVSTLRDKNQSARALIDQISNDFRYVDTAAVFADLPAGHTCRSYNGGSQCLFDGFTISNNRLVLALNLSGVNPATKWVRKEYNIKQFANHQTLTLTEWRSCTLNNFVWVCDPNQRSGETDLLSTAYSLNMVPVNWLSQFNGVIVYEGQNKNPVATPFLSLVFTLKPADLNLPCGDTRIDPGACYKVSTTLNLGGSS